MSEQLPETADIPTTLEVRKSLQQTRDQWQKAVDGLVIEAHKRAAELVTLRDQLENARRNLACYNRALEENA